MAEAAAAQAAAMQNLMTLIQQGITAQGQVVAPTAVDAGLSPFDTTIDLNTKHGFALWENGSKSLPTKFTGKPEEVTTFISDLRSRAQLCRWTSELEFSIPDGTVDTTGNPRTHTVNILDQYGQVTQAQVDTARGARNLASAIRPKQNTKMMQLCISNSLDGTAKIKLINANLTEDCGVTLFHFLMKSTFVSSHTSQFEIRRDLYSLSPKAFGYDIGKMNEHFKTQVLSLGSSGQVVTDQDAKFHLFKAYKMIETPPEFVQYVISLENELDNGSTWNYSSLMDRIESKYMSLRRTAKWDPEGLSQTQLLALVNKLQNEANTKKPDPNKNNDPKNKFKKGSGKPKGDENRKDERPQWMFDSKKADDPESKDWNGKTFYYCEGDHKAKWVEHKPSACKGAAHKKQPPAAANSGNKKPTLEIKRSLASVLEEHVGESSNEVLEALLAVLEAS
jgi:hypothetical protein